MANVNSLFLASDAAVIILAVAIVIAAVIGFIIGGLLKKKSFEKENGSIEELKKRTLDAAIEEGRQLKKEAILEAKEQEIKMK
ncbi:MAG: DUF3552 domain-containing protein, partial [Clostridia bacterium]|nr:DUF3552 domain-containing protein [Clostridia bacterium]